jgi:hypothetical protein
MDQTLSVTLCCELLWPDKHWGNAGGL